MKLENDDFVACWIEEEANPAIEKLTIINLEAANDVSMMLDKKGLDVDRLAHLVDISVAEVSKWLAGHHNFSEKTLGEIVKKVQVAS